MRIPNSSQIYQQVHPVFSLWLSMEGKSVYNTMFIQKGGAAFEATNTASNAHLVVFSNHSQVRDVTIRQTEQQMCFPICATIISGTETNAHGSVGEEQRAIEVVRG